MKANKVFSAGGGGGTKGPSIIDKRGQESKCPFCDKVYTQNGRLKEHIASKHPDEKQADTTAAQPAAAAATNSSLTISPSPRPQTAQSSTRLAHPAAIALVAAANAAAADTSGPKRANSATPSPPSATPRALATGHADAAVEASSNAKVSMMDVGSKAGYYTHKSPKLQLLEWTQSKKMQKPRYSTKVQENGLLTCKVVIPDLKRSENDIVVFLDEQFSTQEAADAEQYGAVAALHRVAGDRQLHMLLPPQYKQLWLDIASASTQKMAERAARAEASEQRKLRESARRSNLAHRGPKSVMLSSSKQAMLQALLKDGFAASAAADGSHGSLALVNPDLLQSVELRLLPMGFTKPQVLQAVAAVARKACRTGSESAAESAVELARDWLFIHTPNDQLPRQYRASTSTVTIISKRSDSNQSSETVVAPLSPLPDLVACSLGAFGYTPSECASALCDGDGTEIGSLQLLYQRLTGIAIRVAVDSTGAPSINVSSGTIPESWAEEVMVLEAIYGQEACFSEQSSGKVCVQVPLPEGSLVAASVQADLYHHQRGSCDGEDPSIQGAVCSHLSIEFHCPLPEHGSEPGSALHYPASPPLVAVACAALPASWLRRLTRRLSRLSTAAAALEQPMLHDLVTATADMLAGEWHKQTVASEGMRGMDGRLRVPLEESSEEEEEEDVEVQYAEDADRDDEEYRLDGSMDGLEDQETVRPGSVMGRDSDTSVSIRAEGVTAVSEEVFREALTEDFESLTISDSEVSSSTLSVAGASTEAILDVKVGRVNRGAPHHSVLHKSGTRPSPSGPLLSGEAAAAESRRLSTHQSWLDSSIEHSSMRQTRAALPAASKREELLRLLRLSGVVVISGATGCGKSTQVPQYILEDAIEQGQGASCSILVTQPRRISALGLAARVAAERGEEVGQTVGYSVKMDSKQTARTRLLFCTTGIVLRRLLSDPSLTSVSHIVLDEVHERSVEIDLLLMLLKDVQSSRSRLNPKGEKQQPLQLVLMSATADADLFAQYMSSTQSAASGRVDTLPQQVGMLTIPGFTYPVREFYLEDILERTGHVVGRSSKYAKKGTKGDDVWSDPESEQYSELTRRSMAVVDENQINYDAMVDLLCHIAVEQLRQGPVAYLSDWPEAAKYLAATKRSQQQGGAVLVFLPGAPEISKLQRMLLASDRLAAAMGGREHLRILPLHGSLSSSDQTRVFSRPPAGTLKVVLATNVAETSITIDDVSFVVDTGRAKEMSHDAERSILRLQEGYVSKAAAQQRRGRAGRVRPGVCFRMFSRQQWEKMDSHTSPEMLRSPLERVALLIKGMAGHELLAGAAGRGGVERVLGGCLSPPKPNAVAGATQLLRQIGAFDGGEELTALGGHLNRMPMDPRVGKMLVYGAMLGCLDPALTVAAALAHGRPVFMSGPVDADQEGLRKPIMGPAIAARSDHVALVAAFNGWCKAKSKGGYSAGSEYCRSHMLSESTLEAVQAGRSEYAGTLAELGFISREDAQELGGGRRGEKGGGRDGFDGSADSAWLSRAVNKNWGNARFLKAAICAGFYPSVLRVQAPKPKFKQVDGGAFEVEPSPSEVKFFDRERGRTFMHPASVCFKIGKFDSGWMVFTSMTQTSKLFVREVSMAPVYSLLLFGGNLEVEGSSGLISVDDWIQFKAPASVGVLVRGVRAELDALLSKKIASPGLELSESKVATVVMDLLSTDGF
ncbi:hypothetical protein CEUSTIGMA_g1510.t1 [Chlamydomonas eustigma]|uniref:RNA helicase n=1 Tax=Chlamydomonas eustigma TaxID=1157962 RepID=A0A250WU24_9CHLO|nr:hypothetical protein CEUSTIGMA_g1510.t1 [Chlamydomonas eustigma]|eukprot:GAX74060.1 hypothetical protein CEUSTIGMA_g1510.t1 [Chlamydomonas eustigma]